MNWKFFVFFIASLWAGLAFADSPPKQPPIEEPSEQQWLDPLTSNSPFTGLSDSAQMVRVNEYTGKATVTIDPLGVGGMFVTPTLQQQKTVDDKLPISSGDDPRRFDNQSMAGWQAHQGYLRADWNWERVVSGEGYPSTRLRFIRADGSVLEFQENRAWGTQGARRGERYLMDQTFEPNANILLTRHKMSNVNAVNDTLSGKAFPPPWWRRSFYKMQEPDGTVTTLRLAGYVDYDNNSERQNRYAIYVPVERKLATGRVIQIHYDGEGEYGIGHAEETNYQPRVKYLQDDWGRRLVHHYESIGDIDRLRYLTLEQTSGSSNVEPSSYQACGGISLSGLVGGTVSGASCQRLAEFQYYQNGGKWLLRRWVKPDGQKTVFSYNAKFGLPLIDSIILPTGGEVKVTFERVDLPSVILAPLAANEPQICENNESRYCWVAIKQGYVRVSRLEHSGATYLYRYQTNTVNSSLVTPDSVKLIRPDWEWTDGKPGYYLVTTVNLEAADENYHRETYYNHPEPDIHSILGTMGGYEGTGSAGSPVARVETYSANGKPASQKSLFWNYYDQADRQAPPGEDRLYVADRAPKVQGFVEKIDGVETLTQFDYFFEVDIPRSPWEPVSPCYPEWVDKGLQRSAQMMCDGLLIRTRQQTIKSQVAEQRFEYQHEFPSARPIDSVSASEEAFFIGLPKDAKELQDNVLTSWFKRIYYPGTGLEKEHQQARLVRYVGGNWPYSPTWLKRNREYYTKESGAKSGLLKREYVGSPEYATEILNYQYDQPVAVKSPGSLPIYSKVDLAGRLTHKIIDKAVERVIYDDAGRATNQFVATKSNPSVPAPNTASSRQCWKVSEGPSSGSCLSAHNLIESNWVSKQTTAVPSNETTLNWTPSDEALDKWGRVSGSYILVDDQTKGIVSRNIYSSIGFKTQEVDEVNGVTTKTWFDVVGRPISQVKFTSSEENAEFKVNYHYSRLADGRSIVRKTLSTLVAAQPELPHSEKLYRSIVTYNETDFFGRPVKQGTEPDGTPPDAGKYTYFDYTFNGNNGHFRTEIRPDDGRYRSMRFDMLGNLLAEDHPEIDGVIYSYDPLRGLLIDTEFLVRPESQLTGPRIWRNTYDNAGRLTHIHALENANGESKLVMYRTYDAWGRTEAQGASVEQVHEVIRFDEMNRPHVVTTNVGNFAVGPEIETGTIDANSDATIQWKSVDDTRFYLVELEQDGTVVWRETVQAPSTSVLVESGTLSSANVVAKVRAVNQEYQPTYWGLKQLIVSGTPAFKLSQNRLEFTTNIDETSTHNLGITNQSNQSLTFNLTWPAAFTGPESVVVAANSSASIDISFSPTRPDDSGEYTVNFSSGGTTQNLTLIGTVNTNCQVTLTPVGGATGSLDFGTALQGTIVSKQVRVTSRYCPPQTSATLSVTEPFYFNNTLPHIGTKIVNISAYDEQITVYYHANVDSGRTEQNHSANFKVTVDRDTLASLPMVGNSIRATHACQIEVVPVNFGEVPTSSEISATANVQINHQCPANTVVDIEIAAPFYFGQTHRQSVTLYGGQSTSSVVLTFRPQSSTQQTYNATAQVLDQGEQVTSFNVSARVGPAVIPDPARVYFPSSSCEQGNGNSSTPCEVSVMASDTNGTTFSVQFAPVLEPNTIMQNIDVAMVSTTNDSSIGRFELINSQEPDKWPTCMTLEQRNRCWAQFRFIPAPSAPLAASIEATAVINNPDREQVLHLKLKGRYEAAPALVTPNEQIEVENIPLNQSRSGSFEITNIGGRQLYYCISSVRTGSQGANLINMGIPRCNSGENDELSHISISSGQTKNHAAIIYADSENSSVGTHVETTFNMLWYSDEVNGTSERGEFTLQVVGDVVEESDRLTLFGTKTKFTRVYNYSGNFRCTRIPLNIRKTSDTDMTYFHVHGLVGTHWFDTERFPGLFLHRYNPGDIILQGQASEESDYTVVFTREHLDEILQSPNGISGEICLEGRWDDRQETIRYCKPAAAFYYDGVPEAHYCQ